MFWNNVVSFLSFTGVKDVAVWQDILFGVLLIPFAIEFYKWIADWINNKKPLSLLLEGFLNSGNEIFVFLSQLSAINDRNEINCDQKYVIRYPNPLPTAKNAVNLAFRKNIDPVWSEGDGECLAGVYNIFGRVGKVQGLKIGDTIKDWDKWSIPTVSIGFSPKTQKLIKKCDPVYFKYEEGANELSIDGSKIKLDSYVPNDASIIQKTFIKGSKTPVLMLAGIGTMGTSVAGYFLSKAGTDLGKLYGNRPFCLLLSAKTDEGRDSVIVRAAYPKPTMDRIIQHPLTFIRYNNDSIFPDN